MIKLLNFLFGWLNKPKTIKTEKFIKWVLKQPDDKPVRMAQNTSPEKPGCVMVQYGREKLGIKGNFRCLIRGFYPFDSDIPKYSLQDGLFKIFRFDVSKREFSKVENFGQLKKYIRLRIKR